MKQKYLSLIFVCLLTGCTGAFLAGAAAGGLVVYEKRPLNIINMDQNIRHQILVEIQESGELTNSRITAASFNRMTILIGQTPRASDRVRAEQLARPVANIRKLYNLIEIGQPISTQQQAMDMWITTKAKAQLLATAGVKSGMIKVVTENGTVYLLGQVTKKQAKLSVDVVRRIEGVRQVVKIFEYNI